MLNVRRWRGVVRRWLKGTAILTLILGVLTALGYGYYRQRYPYGWSHSCDKCLMFALHRYAEEHGGAYPAGEATPEASLSLLYPEYADAEILRGKTVPRTVVQERLERGERLTPETCGWHYVEGLTLKDDRQLAVLWDKVGLGHNGERTPDGGRTVLLVNLGYEYIPGPEWEKFLLQANGFDANIASQNEPSTALPAPLLVVPRGNVVKLRKTRCFLASCAAI